LFYPDKIPGAREICIHPWLNYVFQDETGCAGHASILDYHFSGCLFRCFYMHPAYASGYGTGLNEQAKAENRK